MRRTLLAPLAFASIAAASIAACATGTVTFPTDDGGVPDASSGKDVGSDAVTGGDGGCTKPCAADQVCSNGVCKAQCDLPLAKCGDAGACIDTTSDKTHCGTCSTACATGDAGALQPGPNNPDAGISFDGGYDGGTGWSLGSPTCAKSACGVDCPQGMTQCNDTLCYDTQNFHDRCGSCNTACAASTEWCTQGHCCAVGSAYCNGACADLSTSPTNCGGCGITCGGQTPYCSAGVCAAGVVFTAAFTQSQIATAQCPVWTAFRAKLTGTYSSITISGSSDPVGRTCTGVSANTLCQALRTGSPVSALSCNGNTWYVDTCAGGLEIAADGAACSCKTPGYAVRPCLSSNGDWGGVNTATCTGPSQTMTVTCK